MPLLLTCRLGQRIPAASPAEPLILALSAEDRTRLRGLRHSTCGRPLLLQLPRGEPLQPGEWLGSAEGGGRVRVEAAPEPLLHVTAASTLALLQAAYHLGNRHVAMEIQPTALRLLQDPVLEHLLEHRGLQVASITAPFLPETGAYGHDASHGHTHDARGHGHDPAEAPGDGDGRP